jgi:pimeloyl-ACP methyl ester carboxylesterase
MTNRLVDRFPGKTPPIAIASNTSFASSEIAEFENLTTTVDGHRVRFCAGGRGPTILFLHGWGLGPHAYGPGLRRLAQAGFYVIAPSLPGFNGTNDLESPKRNFVGYAEWVERFAQAVDIREAVVVGHSLGGGVAIQTSHSSPTLVRSLVLLNSVGAPWRTTNVRNQPIDQPMSERPLWNWGVHMSTDIVSILGHVGSVMPSLLEDLVPNMVRNPLGLARVGKMARTADLRGALQEVRNRKVPVTVVHSENDGIIPASSFECLCRAASVTGTTVRGNHSWPLTDPGAFTDVVASAVRRSYSASAA